MLPKIESCRRVARGALQWFGGVWQKGHRQLFVFAVDPQRQHEVYPEWVMPERSGRPSPTRARR
jgi:putative ABC transport system permease protein